MSLSWYTLELNESAKLSQARSELIQKAKAHALHKNVAETKGNIVFGRGDDEAKILFIGEAPGFSENAVGKPFVGRSGKLLEEWVRELGIEQKDYAVMNVVPIIPLSDGKKIRPPTPEEINYFLPTTKRMIEGINPKIIVLLGKSAARAFGLENMRVGQTTQHEARSVFFIYHPAYYLRNGAKGLEDVMRLKAVLERKTDSKKQTTLASFGGK